MNVTVKKLGELKRLEKNVRRHNDKQIGEYMRSLNMFGQLRPMVVDENGTILVGNGMFEAMTRLGWQEADCYVVEGLSEKRKIKLMLADNRVYELGMTDMDAFDELIRELGDDIDVPGWDEDLLQTITSSMAEATAMVESYGTFTEDEISSMNQRQREDHAALVPQEGTDSPLQRPAGAMDGAGQVSDRAAIETPTGALRAAEGHTIICPHCGERILLTPDMIGGV